MSSESIFDNFCTIWLTREPLIVPGAPSITTMCIRQFDYDCDIDTYVEGYDLISDTINEFHEDSEDEEDVEEASASLSQRVSQKWEEEDVDGVNFTYQELVNIHISSRHIEDNACEFVQMVNEKRAQINP
ncbi:hypothetical protein Fcan01_10565 [Folsomia candida]|uniref:Uncharacterized protein n=1 Tax=Folsomia candida TaxID=158441 RepID=A0A226EDF1_FOLCA|nr:hypothetical protein Fcan01_10565 [Folsomia candida]